MPSFALIPASPAPLRQDDDQRRRALKRLALTAGFYGCCALFLCLTWVQGSMPLWAGLLQVGFWVLGLCAFYLLLRKGVVWHADDPMMVFPQVLFGIAAIALSYAVNPYWRGSSLQVLFVLMVFDMQRLRRRQIVFAGWVAVAALVLAVCMTHAFGLSLRDLMQDLLIVAMAAVHVPLLSFLAGEVRSIRLRQEEGRRELDGALARLNELSLRDGLTGAFNRRHGLACVELELRRQARGAQACAIALIDLDHFKQVNDRFGHEAGDTVLKTVAKLAQSACGPHDVFVRWGGEEFMLLMAQASAGEALRRVAALSDAVKRHDWRATLAERGMSFSAGVALPRAGEDAGSVFHRADQALYDAKHRGRDRTCVADGDERR